MSLDRASFIATIQMLKPQSEYKPFGRWRNGLIAARSYTDHVKVREAGPEDMNGLGLIEEECFGTERFSEPTLMAFLVREDAFALVAEDEGAILGVALCLCSRARGEGRIASMAVLKEHRRKGIATRLLKEAEAVLESRGARTFGLEVNVGNEPAISLYLKNGYALRAIIRDYYGAGGHAYVMERTLPSTGKSVRVRPS
jgi:ribosomal-protein-alanine N-acetyltransferase